MNQAMRTPYYIFLTLILLTSCNQKETNKRTENLTEINLNFSDYNPSQHKSFIDLKIENAINPIEQQLKISDSGTVSYTFINDRKKELIFNYENREFSMIASPNEKINTNLNIAELLDWKNKWKNFKVTTGKNKETNNLILSNTGYIDSLIKQAPDGFSNDGQSIDLIYNEEKS